MNRNYKWGVVGLTANVATLLAAMACFGFCKGLYDSDFFAALGFARRDVIRGPAPA